MSSQATISITNYWEIPGTQIPSKSTGLLVSTGIPSLDNVIGGGIPTGSILLLEQDKFDIYAKIVLKYFLAEGIVTSQPIMIASQDMDPKQIISDLPGVVNHDEPQDQEESEDKTEKEMKIAWRYQNMRVIDSSSSIKEHRQFGHFYDLTQKMQTNLFINATIKQWHKCDLVQKNDIFSNPAYNDLLRSIEGVLNTEKYFNFYMRDKRNVLRVALHSLGSRFWVSDSEETTYHDLLKFFYCFRSLVKLSYVVGLVTISVDNFDDYTVVKRLEHMSDAVIKLDAFTHGKRESNPLYKSYHGFLHVKKLPALGILRCHTSPHKDLAFKLRRKKFTIEVIHLPPNIDDTPEHEQDESAGGCMSGSHTNQLDF